MTNEDVKFHFRPFRHYAFMALISLATVFFAIGSTLLVMQMWNYPPAYVPLNVPPKGMSNDGHYARQISKGVIVIGREFQITREIRLRINRELVMNLQRGGEETAKVPGAYQVMLRKELESTNVTYHPGFYKTERELAIPYVPPGEYKIVNVVCWAVNILREDCADLPDVTVEITEDGK